MSESQSSEVVEVNVPPSSKAMKAPKETYPRSLAALIFSKPGVRKDTMACGLCGQELAKKKDCSRLALSPSQVLNHLEARHPDLVKERDEDKVCSITNVIVILDRLSSFSRRPSQL